jgi:hypothetical protein
MEKGGSKMESEETDRGNDIKLVLCRLCGKQKPAKEFEVIVLSRIGNALIKFAGCHACATVIFNATVIVQETIKKYMDEQSKIIMPPNGVVGPRG